MLDGTVAAVAVRVMSLPAVADPRGGGPNLNTTGLVGWGVKNLIPLLLLGIGLLMIAGAKRGKFSDNARVLSNVLLGGVIIAGSAAIYTLASGISNLALGG